MYEPEKFLSPSEEIRRTTLPPAFEETLLADIAKVTKFLESSRPPGAIDANGCALLKLLHPSLSIVEGSIDVLIVSPDLSKQGRIAMGWIGGGSMRGTWLEQDGVTIDPFADQRMREKDPVQTSKWHQLPIVMRSSETPEPLDIIYDKTATTDVNRRGHLLKELYDLRAETDEYRLLCAPSFVLSDRGLSEHAEESLWAKAVGIANIKQAPSFPKTATPKPTHEQVHTGEAPPPAILSPDGQRRAGTRYAPEPLSAAKIGAAIVSGILVATLILMAS